jgi:DNA-binding transcriptional MerR regulator
MRLDELAREAGVATTTVRLYQNRGLLRGPRLEGRTGFYDEGHLARLALIGRLQQQGFSLAGIGRLLETWEGGRDLAELVGTERELGLLLGRRHELVLEPQELLARFPAGSLTPELVQRAMGDGLVEPMDDGRFRVPDRRFLDAGATLVRLGIPASVVLDEWSHLSDMADGIAARFVSVFEQHVLPAGRRPAPDSGPASDLAATLAVLRHTAAQVLSAAVDASLAREGGRRLAEVAAAWEPEEQVGTGSPTGRGGHGAGSGPGASAGQRPAAAP